MHVFRVEDEGRSLQAKKVEHPRTLPIRGWREKHVKQISLSSLVLKIS